MEINMTFTLRTYNDLIKNFECNLLYFCEYHHVASVNALSQPRKHQILFLQKTIELLNHSNDEVNKAKILTGMMLLTNLVIEKSYSNSMFSATAKSTLHRLLSINIGVSEANTIQHEDKFVFIDSAIKFITKQIFNDGLMQQGLLQNHPFSNITELKLEEYWDIGVFAVAGASCGWFQKLIQQQNNEAKTKESEVPTFISLANNSKNNCIFSGNKSKSQTDDENEESEREYQSP